MNNIPIEARIIELEKRVAFLDHSVEELIEVITDQKKLIDSLQVKLDRLNNQLSGDSLVRPLDEEDKPPHY
ncbi:MAG: SlyX family protein [Candidatus Omnitrophota bacterium]